MWPIAKYTILESLRDRIYLGFLVALIFLSFVMVLFGAAPFGLTNLVVERLGWMTVDVILSILAAIYTVNNLVRERDRKILYSHLTLPLGRVRYLIGKAFGLWLTLLALALAGTTVIVLGDWLYASVSTVPLKLFWLVPSVMLKVAVMIAYALLLTQVTSGMLTATLFSLGIYLIGNGGDDLLQLAESMSEPALQEMLQYLYYVVPNLQLVDFEHATLYGGGVALSTLGYSVSYALAYSAAAITISCLIFLRKDL